MNYTNTPGNETKNDSYIPKRRNPRTYIYEQRTYEVKPHQLEILQNINSLPKKYLHYLVCQQSNKHRNLTLNELKHFIRKGIRNYCKNLSLTFNRGDENKYVKYYCVFETREDFFKSQHENKIVDEEFEMGIHFHLFLTSPDNYPWISFPSLIHSIYSELTHLQHNRRCISKFDYNRLKTMDENFILYHTKQLMFRSSKEMIMTNFINFKY